MAFNKFYVSQNDVANPQQLQRVVNTIQQNIEDAVNKVEKLSIVDNIIYENVRINTSTVLQHKLNRKPKGYIVIAKTANAQIWNGSITDTEISLNSSGDVTISVYVF